jgi:hypothetical protein
MDSMTLPRARVVERVENANLDELRRVDINDVYVHMEWLRQSRSSPMDLYRRWERQNGSWRSGAAPERKFAVDAAQTPPNLLVSPYDIRAFSLNSMTKRLRVAGLPTETCAEVTQRGISYYENA